MKYVEEAEGKKKGVSMETTNVCTKTEVLTSLTIAQPTDPKGSLLPEVVDESTNKPTPVFNPLPTGRLNIMIALKNVKQMKIKNCVIALN